MRYLVTLLVLITVSAEAQTVIPRAAAQYKRALIANSRIAWGLNSPVALFASQIAQESGFRPDAQSPYAKGLTQFTSDTARWIGQAYPEELGDVDVWNPSWSLRALSRYDKHLHERATFAASECDRFSFVLSGFNGGSGWWSRDRGLASKNGADPSKWWGHVEFFSSRSKAAFNENRSYVKRIVYRWQPLFIQAGWGTGVTC